MVLVGLAAALVCRRTDFTPATSAAETSDQSRYPDGRPAAKLRLAATDQGIVLCHGDGPQRCDSYGARDACVYQADGLYYMVYDGAGPNGWLAAGATSKDLVHWKKTGPALELGKPGEDDSASASNATIYRDGAAWHMFYMGTPHATPPPELVPAFPYLTMKARAASPAGPWTKQPDVIPFRTKPGTYYTVEALPGRIIKHRGQYRMFFSAATNHPIRRCLSIARTKDLDGPWAVDPEPIVPPTEQVETSSLYFEPANQTWFLFTDHIGVAPDGFEYTDAIWVYWSKDLDHWNVDHKAVVLDTAGCTWSKNIVGLPSVIKVGNRLAVFYDGSSEAKMPHGVKSHMNRDIALAWLPLPLAPPGQDGRQR
jgi:predicted GH43/DUF377 family glycosyl hydrolase